MKASRRVVMTDIQPSVFRDKFVLVRVDYNVPVAAVQDVMSTRSKQSSAVGHHHTWLVTNDAKIRASLATINHLTEAGAKVVLCSHMGRPPRDLPENCIGKPRASKMALMKGGDCLLLENTRFHSDEEEKNDPAFALALADGIDIFIMEAFSSCHRAHASIVLRPLLPPILDVGQGLGCIGMHAKEEIIGLDRCIMNPEHPLMAIIGGAKMSSKLPVIGALLKSGSLDYLVIGGAMAHTFLVAKGIPVGNSLCEDSAELQFLARQIMEECEEAKVHLILPSDFVLNQEETAKEKAETEAVAVVPTGGVVEDVGPLTVSTIITAMQECKTVFFNGPLGHYEKPLFATSTNAVIDWLASRGSDVISVVCGGDTVAAVEAHLHLPEKHGMTTSAGRKGLSRASTASSSRLPHDLPTSGWGTFAASHFSHLSLAGGAALEYLEKRRMPGLEVLPFLAELPDSVLTDEAKKEKSSGSDDYSSRHYRLSRGERPSEAVVTAKADV